MGELPLAIGCRWSAAEVPAEPLVRPIQRTRYAEEGFTVAERAPLRIVVDDRERADGKVPAALAARDDVTDDLAAVDGIGLKTAAKVRWAVQEPAVDYGGVSFRTTATHPEGNSDDLRQADAENRA
jgi:hypothetical protein